MVVSSAAEAEIGGLFTNCKEAEVIRQTLIDMNHPQDPTPVQTDNSTASGLADDSIKQQKTRAIDMRFHWIRDRQQQQHFRIYWDKAKRNLADYFTKHHSPTHHQAMRHTYLHPNPQKLANLSQQLHCEGVLNSIPRIGMERALKRQPAQPLARKASPTLASFTLN